jgi:hypothetical protein
MSALRLRRTYVTGAKTVEPRKDGSPYTARVPRSPGGRTSATGRQWRPPSTLRRSVREKKPPACHATRAVWKRTGATWWSVPPTACQVTPPSRVAKSVANGAVGSCTTSQPWRRRGTRSSPTRRREHRATRPQRSATSGRRRSCGRGEPGRCRRTRRRPSRADGRGRRRRRRRCRARRAGRSFGNGRRSRSSRAAPPAARTIRGRYRRSRSRRREAVRPRARPPQRGS